MARSQPTRGYGLTPGLNTVHDSDHGSDVLATRSSESGNHGGSLMQGPGLTQREIVATLRHAVDQTIAEGVDRSNAIRLVARRYDVPPIAVVAALRGGGA